MDYKQLFEKLANLDSQSKKEMLKDLLECMVDATCFDTVKDSLVDVCFSKSIHVANAWQDNYLEKQWERIAKRLDKTNFDC